MTYTTAQIGKLIENGKETCEVGKALSILNTLGIKITLSPPLLSEK